MKVLLTGSSGRIGRAIYAALIERHEVVGLDRYPFSTTRLVGDFTDGPLLRRALDGVDAVIHTAALHAPHVGVVDEAAFARVNVDGVGALVAAMGEAGVATLVYTSTTALYGDAVVAGACAWIDEDTAPRPRTVYHRSKLEAERLLETAAGPRLAVRVIRMSRCFPEPADRMAVYRLHRGIDARDVGDAHAAALGAAGPSFQRYIASGRTPFVPADAERLARDPRGLLAERCPDLVEAFRRRGWTLPATIDRVYDAGAAERALGWRSRHGFGDVLARHDARDLEVLPLSPWFRNRSTE
ncbi:NAD-dependent epimerase/dehydratase family protein [Marilutibacter maris]|uniref:Nucleoside-diphosphate-sugar epimerase n=1 Tax=Marilutibacter maris TaxID=1605891 RepID=A0A2U9T6L5_9GAMM|nr:NAD(P)-dependent oxidoreductase [Lysobacter maris]AWV06138.1 nucleoside-diphosphate-sugar epimerase [Lysobacter maris]